MQKGTFLGIALVVVLALGIAACGGGGETTSTPKPPAGTTTTTPTGGGTVEGEVVNIGQREDPYVFEPKTYEFEAGKTYALTFAPVTQFHTFTVEELDLDIQMMPGESKAVSFTPTKKGTFRLYCIPHQGLNMVGEVTVK